MTPVNTLEHAFELIETHVQKNLMNGLVCRGLVEEGECEKCVLYPYNICGFDDSEKVIKFLRKRKLEKLLSK